jgi:hypothetical protein
VINNLGTKARNEEPDALKFLASHLIRNGDTGLIVLQLILTQITLRTKCYGTLPSCLYSSLTARCSTGVTWFPATDDVSRGWGRIAKMLQIMPVEMTHQRLSFMSANNHLLITKAEL